MHHQRLSANHSVIVTKHESRTNRISEGADLLIAVHQLQKREDALSHEAEFGEIAKTMRAASAHCLKLEPFVRHHVSTPSVYFETSALSKRWRVGGGRKLVVCVCPIGREVHIHNTLSKWSVPGWSERVRLEEKFT